MSGDLMHMLTGAREKAVALAKAKQAEIAAMTDRLHAELAELEQDVADLDGHIAVQQEKETRRKATPPAAPVQIAACERCIGKPVPAFARVVVASTNGKAVLDQVLCVEHTDAEQTTGRIGMATVTVHPLNAAPSDPASTLIDPPAASTQETTDAER